MKWLKVLFYFAAAVLVFIGATCLTIVFSLKDASTVICPDVRGLDVEEARTVATNKGLSLVIIRYEKKKDVPYNRVLSQVPDASIPVREGRTLSVVVSDGPRTTEVPSFLGMSLEEAQAELQARGVPIKRVIYVPSETIGKVLAQVPASGQNIIGEEGMSLVVGGKEKRFFVMPEIGSQDYQAAMEEMDRKQIRYSVSSAGLLGLLSRTPPLSIPPRTIFGEDQVLEIKTGIGG